VQVTKDGGATWQTVYEKFGDILTWSPKSIVLDPSYAVFDFQFRFFMRSDFLVRYPGWYIDDVAVSVSEPYDIAVPCGTIPGGIVAGYVFDANFPTEKLIGATVATATTSALTIANAEDPDHAGLYYMFQAVESDPEDVEFTVSLPKYETKVETRAIAQDVVNHEDFELGAGMLSADPTEIERTIWLHDDPEFTALTLINDGAVDANFTLREEDQGFQPYSIPAFTGKVTQSSEPASIFRDPNAAATVGGLELNALSGRYGITAAPPAYGIDLFTDQLYLWPDASVPGTSTLVGTPAATSLFAGDFMGSDFSTLYAVSYDNNNLYAIDTATGVATLIGTTTPPSGATFSGLAGGPGVMYGMATACNTSSTLMEVDLTTGATTTIGTLPNATCMIDITYVPDDGMLYGVDLVTNSLHRIDPATGVDTIVGDLGADPNYAQGMDYDEENNVLYWAAYTSAAELRIIDITTGASVPVGTFTQGEVDSFAIAAGGSGGGVPWLDEVPVEGYVPAMGSLDVQLEFNVDDIEQPGDYFANLKISTDTPYPVPSIPVTLHVVRPFDYGNIKGNITATGKCDLDPAPFADATINFYKDGVLAYSTGTDENGYYSYALKNGTYDVEVVAEGYVSQMVFGVVVGMSTDTFVDFQLRLNDTCLSVDPESFYQELNPDETATQTMTLINTGALEAPFEISERPGDGPVPYSKAWDVELVLDDGTAEDAIGIGGSAAFMVVNRFTPSEDQFPFLLEQVDISFEASGAVAAGDQLRIVVYQNTTGSEDPASGSELLYQQDAVVVDAAGWNNYVLDEPVLLEGPGDVIIGAIFLKVPGTSYFPASIDQTDSQERSWAGWLSGDVPAEPILPPDESWILIDDAGFPGNWMIRGMGSAGSTDIVWLTEDPTAGVVDPDGGTVDVTLTFDSTGLTWGDYFGSLHVNSPSEATMNIPVQLRNFPAADTGFAQGYVYALEICNVNPAPVANEVVSFLQDGVVVYQILTNSEGFYKTAIPEGTYDIEVEIDGYETQTIEGLVITAGETTVQDLTLRLLAPCLQAAPAELEKYLLPDTTGTQTLKLTNIGAAEGTFELFEVAPAETQADQLILDPSFEAYTPNPYWDEYSENFGTPLCTVDDCGTGTGTGPKTGDVWSWFGGSTTGDVGYVSQDVLINPGSAIMSFWVEQVVCGDAGAGNYLALVIDDEEVWRTDGLDPACGTLGYRKIELDVSDFADGATHEIKFESVTLGNGNFFLDDVELQLEAGGGDVLWLSEAPTAGLVPAGASTNVTITYDTAGLALGDYLAALRVKNLPAPDLTLPVTLHVVDEFPVFYLYLPLILK
jgi:hypothetical protein